MVTSRIWVDKLSKAQSVLWWMTNIVQRHYGSKPIHNLPKSMCKKCLITYQHNLPYQRFVLSTYLVHDSGTRTKKSIACGLTLILGGLYLPVLSLKNIKSQKSRFSCNLAEITRFHKKCYFRWNPRFPPKTCLQSNVTIAAYYLHI